MYSLEHCHYYSATSGLVVAFTGRGVGPETVTPQRASADLKDGVVIDRGKVEAKMNAFISKVISGSLVNVTLGFCVCN